MTVANVALYIALIGYVLLKKMQGQPLKEGKKLFVLPVLLVIIGYGDMTQSTLKPLEITLIVIGAIVSLSLGALRGRADKLSMHDEIPFMQWTKVSLGLFAVNIATKLVLDIIGVAAGGTASAAGNSLLFTLGLTLLAEAGVLWLRSAGSSVLRPPLSNDTSRS